MVELQNSTKIGREPFRILWSILLQCSINDICTTYIKQFYQKYLRLSDIKATVELNQWNKELDKDCIQMILKEADERMESILKKAHHHMKGRKEYKNELLNHYLTDNTLRTTSVKNILDGSNLDAKEISDLSDAGSPWTLSELFKKYVSFYYKKVAKLEHRLVKKTQVLFLYHLNSNSCIYAQKETGIFCQNNVVKGRNYFCAEHEVFMDSYVLPLNTIRQPAIKQQNRNYIKDTLDHLGQGPVDYTKLYTQPRFAFIKEEIQKAPMAKKEMLIHWLIRSMFGTLQPISEKNQSYSMKNMHYHKVDLAPFIPGVVITYFVGWDNVAEDMKKDDTKDISAVIQICTVINTQTKNMHLCPEKIKTLLTLDVLWWFYFSVPELRQKNAQQIRIIDCKYMPKKPLEKNSPELLTDHLGEDTILYTYWTQAKKQGWAPPYYDTDAIITNEVKNEASSIQQNTKKVSE